MSALTHRASTGALVIGALLLLVSIAVAASGFALFSGEAFLVLLSVVVFADSVDVLVRVHLRRLAAPPPSAGASGGPSVTLDIADFTPVQKQLHLRPWAMVVSVHNLEGEMYDFKGTFSRFRERLWIIDDGSTDRTVSLLQRAGFRCVSGLVNRRKPGAIRQLLRDLPPEIETVVVLDPDVSPREGGGGPISEFESVVSEFQRSGMAAVTPSIEIRRDGLLSRFQALEYYLALGLGRKSLGDCAVNSGISMYRRELLERALTEHSLSVYAEDLETSLILLGAGERIYFDDRWVVETDGKRTWGGLFSQRVGWYYGLLKVYVERFEDVGRVARRGPFAAYHFLVYTGLLTILLHPVRLLLGCGAILGLLNLVDGLLGLTLIPDRPLTTPWILVASYAQYTFLGFVGLLAAVPPRDRLRLAPVVPIYLCYALALYLPIAVGYLNWLSLRWVGRRVYVDHYMDETSLHGQMRGRRPAPEEEAA